VNFAIQKRFPEEWEEYRSEWQSHLGLLKKINGDQTSQLTERSSLAGVCDKKLFFIVAAVG
jgi:hypothetical protein